MKPVRSVSQLYGRHPGADIFILGTGPSARVFPLSLLEGRVSIGLNMAWKLAPVTYGITIHPDLNIPEMMPGEQPRPEITWATKYARLDGLSEEKKEYGRKHFLFFETEVSISTSRPGEPGNSGRHVDLLRAPRGDFLYLWSSISQAAVNLAVNMGAGNIFLIGCDNCALLSNHHAHAQHTRWRGAEPDMRYQQYYEGLAEIRSVLRSRGVSLLTLTPFLGLDKFEQDFRRLCAELEVPRHIENRDISPALKFQEYVDWAKRLVKAGARYFLGQSHV